MDKESFYATALSSRMNYIRKASTPLLPGNCVAKDGARAMVISALLASPTMIWMVELAQAACQYNCSSASMEIHMLLQICSYRINLLKLCGV
jgi:hypothetical protein